MREVLRNPAYAKLFTAQVGALLGTGLLTVALGLLAFDFAGEDAGIVLGVALTIKMVAYVGVAPVINAITGRVPRKVLLVAADLVRAAIAVSLPFVTEAWQIYGLIFLLQSASATFTPAFQAVIPDILPDERHYTRALSLSRLAYDLESLVSPALAAVLLTVISYHNLFLGTVAGFLISAGLVLITRLPRTATPATSGSFVDRLTRGTRVFVRVPELRALLALNLVVATASAMVIVNTVVITQGLLHRPQSDVALLLGAYGAGSMIIALAAPRLLDHVTDRSVMLAGSVLVPVGLAAAGVLVATAPAPGTWFALLGVWLLLGSATSLVLTPSSRLLRRNADSGGRPAVFAAQFSLSHACYLVTYPAAGVLGVRAGLPVALAVFVVLAAAAAVTAHRLWTAAPLRTPEAARVDG